MTEYFLGAYWKSRRESLEECTERALGWFRELDRIRTEPITWLAIPRGGSSRVTEVSPTHKETLEKLLLGGRNYSDIGRQAIEELGFNLWLHTREDGEVAGEVSIACGSYSPYVSNCIALSRVEQIVRIESEACRELVRTTAAVWQPDWAGLISRDAMKRRDYQARSPFVDWMTYVSDEWLPDPPTLAAPSIAERLPGGTLIVVQDTPPDVDNPEHQRNIRRVEKALSGR